MVQDLGCQVSSRGSCKAVPKSLHRLSDVGIENLQRKARVGIEIRLSCFETGQCQNVCKTWSFRPGIWSLGLGIFFFFMRCFSGVLRIEADLGLGQVRC